MFINLTLVVSLPSKVKCRSFSLNACAYSPWWPMGPFFHALWFDPEELRRCPVGGYTDEADVLSDPLLFGHLQYLKWQRRCAFSLGNLVMIRRCFFRSPGRTMRSFFAEAGFGGACAAESAGSGKATTVSRAVLVGLLGGLQLFRVQVYHSFCSQATDCFQVGG